MAASPKVGALILLAVTGARTADIVPADLFRLVRTNALEKTHRILAYACVETIDRTQYLPGKQARTCDQSWPPRGPLAVRDRVRVDVALVNSNEIFSWAGARKFESHDLDKIVGVGATTTGEFAGFLLSVFDHQPDRLRYTGLHDGLATFDYNVPLATSGYNFRSGNGPPVRLPFHGTFSATPLTGELTELTVEPDGALDSDLICRLRHVVQYPAATAEGSRPGIPSNSSMQSWYRSGDQIVNDTHYSGCREYVGRSTISFDETSSNSPGKADPVQLPALRARVRFSIELAKRIDTSAAAAGDEVLGALRRDVRQGGRVVARAGEQVHGRILLLRQYLEPQGEWLIAIRFDRIERDGVEQPLSLSPLDDGLRAGPALQRFPQRAEILDKPEGSGLFILRSNEQLVLDSRFRSEWETR
jgi:hypothetical protein